MERLRSRFDMSFSTKVLVPVVVCMGLLLAISVWIVNRRLGQQFQTEAVRTLATADAVFRNSQKIYRNNLLLRFRNLPREPRWKAVFQSSDPATLKDLLPQLLGEHHVDVILYTSEQTELIASAKRDPIVSIAEFETASFEAVKRAMADEEQVDTIRVAERLFDVVSIPVKGTGENQIGVLTFGSEIGDASAQEFSLITHSQIALLASGKVVASTVANPDSLQEFGGIFDDCIARSGLVGVPKDLLLGDEHYFCAAGKFTTLGGDDSLGYLLLSSYEQPWRALHNTRQLLLLVSTFAIIIGTAIVWFLVTKVTEPLRQLRDTAEAVGRGDFSRKVEVCSRDECGELAEVFNRMTHNLKNSREQLEMTVETLKTTQAQLIQSEKLSGIGEFVAGVAHELNNPLTSVMGFSELLKSADTNPQHKRYLEMIHKSALRCQKIVQSLLSFARRHQPERKLSSINELVEGAVEILQYQMRTSNIEVTCNLDLKLPRAMVDPHQVQQVFLNIINNGRQAIEAHRPNGWVRISSETSGDRIRVTFQDSGPGISEENMSKVFDPFFTTKEVGKGTGLGLSLCYGIIKEHGGTITVRSKPGQGATFVVELPLAEQGKNQEPVISRAPASAEAAPATPAAPGCAAEGIGKKILVIDDEEAILQMVREALSGHGYEVDIASDGEAALKQLTRKPYDLALCDWKMPGLSGQQIYERIRSTNPALSERMIFITGDVINDKTQTFLKERKKTCLSKPFSLSEFRTAIGQALAAA